MHAHRPKCDVHTRGGCGRVKGRRAGLYEIELHHKQRGGVDTRCFLVELRVEMGARRRVELLGVGVQRANILDVKPAIVVVVVVTGVARRVEVRVPLFRIGIPWADVRSVGHVVGIVIAVADVPGVVLVEVRLVEVVDVHAVVERVEDPIAVRVRLDDARGRAPVVRRQVRVVAGLLGVDAAVAALARHAGADLETPNAGVADIGALAEREHIGRSRAGGGIRRCEVARVEALLGRHATEAADAVVRVA